MGKVVLTCFSGCRKTHDFPPTTLKMKILLILLSFLVAINMSSGKKYLVETKDRLKSERKGNYYSANDYNQETTAGTKQQGQDYFLGLGIGLGSMFQQVQSLLQSQSVQG